MTFNLENGVLTIEIEGHIDSVNAPSIEKEILEIVEKNPHDKLIVDAEKLEYISSAGLRVILRLRKAEQDFRVVNASSDVYEVFEMTGFTEMMNIEKAYRKMSVDGCEKLGEGSNGIVYRYDPETVVKVYRNPDALDDIHRERDLARKALILGIPTAIPFDVVKVDDKYASVFELLNAKSFSKLIKADPANIDHYVELFVDLLKQIHSTQVNPGDMPEMKTVALGWADFLKNYLPQDQADKFYSLIEEVPDRQTMIHGDYHTNNVEMQNGEILLIDMDTLAVGHPVFELASMFLAFVGFGESDPQAVEDFMGIPYSTTQEVWHKALPVYLGTTDANVVSAVEKKAKVIGYARLLRRTIRRESDTQVGKKRIENCKEKLGELLSQVSSLDF